MMTLQNKQAIFAQNMAKLILHIFETGCSVTMGECYRTPEQAKIDVEKGTGILRSLHCDRLAVDMNIFDKNGKLLMNKDDYEPFGIYWESLHVNNRWGGRFVHLVDSGHFEMQNIN